jgi:hypothetical protein
MGRVTLLVGVRVSGEFVTWGGPGREGRALGRGAGFDDGVGLGEGVGLGDGKLGAEEMTARAFSMIVGLGHGFRVEGDSFEGFEEVLGEDDGAAEVIEVHGQ